MGSSIDLKSKISGFFLTSTLGVIWGGAMPMFFGKRNWVWAKLSEMSVFEYGARCVLW
jgi:hypothetical protein